MAKRITYVTDGWNALLTNCPFGLKTRRSVIKVGSIYCIDKCSYRGVHYTDFDVECNHP